MSSNSYTVGFNSYVDIATSMASQSPTHRQAKESDLDDVPLSPSAEGYFKINTPTRLNVEWSQRVDIWQAQMPDKGTPIEECQSAKEVRFPALFLQHPIAAMSIWNVLEAFYELDRLVCSGESLDPVVDWEAMPPFEYLDARKVERKWKKSLHSLKKDLKEEHMSNLSEISDTMSLFGAPKKTEVMKRENRNAPWNALKEGSSKNKRDSLRRRIDGIYSGIAKLEKVQVDLQRNLEENLEGVSLVGEMLDTISVAAQKRFSMIESLRHEGLEDDVALDNEMIEQDAKPDAAWMNVNSEVSRERWHFKTPIRRNSMKTNGTFCAPVNDADRKLTCEQ